MWFRCFSDGAGVKMWCRCCSDGGSIGEVVLMTGECLG